MSITFGSDVSHLSLGPYCLHTCNYMMCVDMVACIDYMTHHVVD